LYHKLKQRFRECGLELHPDKTKIVYCKDENRKRIFPLNSFTFLGYEFRARVCKNTKQNSIFLSFTPAASKVAMKSMRAKTRSHNVRNRADLSIESIAKWFNPILSGW
jgi:RNA-directed DNA polymerase